MTDPKPTRRFHPTPGWLVFALLVVEGLFWLSERFSWFGFNSHKGWTVLIAVAVVGGAMLVMLLWFIASLLIRWQFQFSIRSLLVLVVAVAVPFSWLAVERMEAAKQGNLVEWVRKSSGSVQYDYEFDASNNFLRNASPSAPSWLFELLGTDFFANIATVSLHDSEISDVDLELLARLNRLRALYLERTNVTDVGLEKLKGLTELQELWLADTQVTGVGLEHLKGLTQLHRLVFDRSPVSDAGLDQLKRLTHLQDLLLNQTHVTDSGLMHLTGLAQLKGLSLDNTSVTDTGLKQLKGLTQLQVLELSDTKLTDAGLEQLTALTQLQRLSLIHNRLTDDGVRKLRQALPNCTIVWP